MIDWSKLTFHYTETDFVVRSACCNGVWEKPYATRDKYIKIHAAATGLQYGQECFEGLKAFRGIDGNVRIFRMEENARRMQRSAEGLLMTPVPENIFCEAILLALEKNIDFLPPYETGATLYFRPVLIATTPEISVGPGKDCEFIVIPTPIGPYFPNGFKGTPFIVNRHIDRSAPQGTGQWKVGGNYAASFRASEVAHAMGYECMFTDAKTHKYIDECTASNFIGIRQYSKLQGSARTTAKRSTVSNANDLQRSDLIYEYLTPRSSAILPSITNDSLMTLAREMGLKVTRRRIRIEELEEMSEAAACGTACVISPITKVFDPDKNCTYHFGKPGPILTRLYNALQDIQYGRTEDKHGWCTVVLS
ncbi:MAG: branched-chain amino acid aminotransferase [Paludibacteraceae bacterium]|nr:branched-chain amino acid aminotransferase [Paludibacteraceae bacterium]